jgi:RNA polymerase sigma factor (sigma-70 family)
VESVSAERESPRQGPDDAARKRVAVETYARNETTLRRTAHRYSLCADDADDALQRGLEILLRKAPSDDPRELIKWMQTVVKHEALAIRRERERVLGEPPAGGGGDDWIASLPSSSDGPPERAERREAVARSREALRALKPHELRALALLAEGYSYLEIGEITGYSQTKVNRCLAEGRARFRKLIAGGEDGSRCAELAPLLSAFCDGEAKPEEMAQVREHLRVCAHCRSTLRAYRSAPAAAAALAPSLPLARSLWERAHDAVAGLASRFGGGAAEPVSQVAGGAGGGGAAALVKAAAVCIGAGGAAACIAAGIVPSPLDLSAEQERPRMERRVADLSAPEVPAPAVEYEPATPRPEPEPAREPRSERDRSPDQQAPPAESEPVAEPASASSGDTIEYTPPPAPEPAPEPVPVTSSGGGSPAGEFGP